MKKIAKLIAILSLMCCFSMCSCESFEFLSFLNGNEEISDGSDDITIDDSDEEETNKPDNSEDEESGSPEDSETDEPDENGGNWTAGMPLN